MEKNYFRVLVFGSITTHSGTAAMVKSLSPFTTVKEFNYRYRSIPSGTRHVFPKMFYRLIECVYWSLRLFKEISEFHADIIIAEYAYFTGLIGAIAAIMSRKPCIIRAIGSDLKFDSQMLLSKTPVSWSLKNVSGVICVSRDLEKTAKEFGAKSTIVLPPPIDFPDLDDQDFRKDWDIITVASLTPVKSLSYLIMAMRTLNDSKLAIIGEGPERDNLKSLSSNLGVNNRVFFLGWVDHNMIWDFLQSAKVFVLPSVSEGTPRAIIEAMACGLPIVATKVGGIPELVKEGVNGFLVPPQNEEALVEAIERILKNVNLRKKISHENKKTAKKYGMENIGQRMYNYLRSFV